MKRGVEISTEHFPLVIIRLGEELTTEDLATLGAGLREIFARKQKFISISDIRATKSLPDAKMRSAIAVWWKGIEAEQRAWNLGSANILSSAPVRGALTAISWLFSPPTPQGYVRDIPEALDWAERRLREAGLALPESAAALRARGSH